MAPSAACTAADRETQGAAAAAPRAALRVHEADLRVLAAYRRLVPPAGPCRGADGWAAHQNSTGIVKEPRTSQVCAASISTILRGGRRAFTGHPRRGGSCEAVRGSVPDPRVQAAPCRLRNPYGGHAPSLGMPDRPVGAARLGGASRSTPMGGSPGRHPESVAGSPRAWGSPPSTTAPRAELADPCGSRRPTSRSPVELPDPPAFGGATTFGCPRRTSSAWGSGPSGHPPPASGHNVAGPAGAVKSEVVGTVPPWVCRGRHPWADRPASASTGVDAGPGGGRTSVRKVAAGWGRLVGVRLVTSVGGGAAGAWAVAQVRLGPARRMGSCGLGSSRRPGSVWNGWGRRGRSRGYGSDGLVAAAGHG
jgi:hypothetical protein